MIRRLFKVVARFFKRSLLYLCLGVGGVLGSQVSHIEYLQERDLERERAFWKDLLNFQAQISSSSQDQKNTVLKTASYVIPPLPAFSKSLSLHSQSMFVAMPQAIAVQNLDSKQSLSEQSLKGTASAEEELEQRTWKEKVDLIESWRTARLRSLEVEIEQSRCSSLFSRFIKAANYIESRYKTDEPDPYYLAIPITKKSLGPLFAGLVGGFACYTVILSIVSWILRGIYSLFKRD